MPFRKGLSASTCALALALSLVACGGSAGDATNPGQPTTSGGSSQPSATPSPTPATSPLPATYSPTDWITFRDVPAEPASVLAAVETSIRYEVERFRSHREVEMSEDIADYATADEVANAERSVDGARSQELRLGGVVTVRIEEASVDGDTATIRSCADQSELTNIFDDDRGEVTPDAATEQPRLVIVHELTREDDRWLVAVREADGDC